MIGKVLRGRSVGGLLRYLYGPGRANEHTNPHLAAGWDDPAQLEPTLGDRGRPDLRRLAGLLGQPPLATGVDPATRPVWHCPLRTAPGDRVLTDEEWESVCRDVLDRTGLAPAGDDGGCRWVAVRHADDHVHLVVTLARQDGRRPRLSNDYYRVAEACRAAETRLGLAVTPDRDRTAATRPSRAEQEKARRAGRREPPRMSLRREVRVAAAAAGDLDGFLTRLGDAGLLVRPRHSSLQPGTVTGYAVAWPGDRGRDGLPVWFGGGTLAPDLSLPKLQRRWAGEPAPRQPVRLSLAERAAVWRQAQTAATAAAGRVRTLAGTDPAAAADAAHAAGVLLTGAARVAEGRADGPLTDAADRFDRAARELWARTPDRTPTGDGLRAAARALALCGRASRDETTQLLALTAAMAGLIDAVADLRRAQARTAQAAAAREAADRLRRQSPPGGGSAPQQNRPRSVAAHHVQAYHPRRPAGALR